MPKLAGASFGTAARLWPDLSWSVDTHTPNTGRFSSALPLSGTTTVSPYTAPTAIPGATLTTTALTTNALTTAALATAALTTSAVPTATTTTADTSSTNYTTHATVLTSDTGTTSFSKWTFKWTTHFPTGTTNTPTRKLTTDTAIFITGTTHFATGATTFAATGRSPALPST